MLSMKRRPLNPRYQKHDVHPPPAIPLTKAGFPTSMKAIKLPQFNTHFNPVPCGRWRGCAWESLDWWQQTR